jgi:hypothetical protein
MSGRGRGRGRGGGGAYRGGGGGRGYAIHSIRPYGHIMADTGFLPRSGRDDVQ